MLLILLVSISGIYEWAATQPVLARELGISGIEGFESSTLELDIDALQISSENIITTSPLTDISLFINSLLDLFGTMWSIFMRLMFGWQKLINAIFASLDLQSISTVFVVPISIIQILTALYFMRDIVNTIRGVGG